MFTRLKNGRAHADLRALDRLREQREHGAEEHREGGGHQEEVVQQEGRLARDDRVELALRVQALEPPGQQREGAQDDQGQEAEEELADRALAEGVHRADDAGAGEEGAEQGEAEGQDDQGQVPELQHAPPLLDHHRVQERGAGEPRHEGRVLHRVPRPVAAPAQHVIAPPAADQQAEREEVPGHDRPAPGDRDPLVAGPPDDERGHREGERHREAGEAQVERHRMGDHPRVLEQRIEAAAVRGHRREPLEGRSGDRHHQQEERGEAEHHREHPRVELGLGAPVAADHDQRVDREHEGPQDDRAFERAPQRGDAVVERRAQVGVERDVAHREVEGEEGAHQQQHAAHHQHRDPDGGALRGAAQIRPAAHRAQRGGPRAVDREHQRRDGGRVAQLGDHGVPSPLSVLSSSL